MKKTIIGVLALAAAVAAVRRYGPSLEKRAMAKCREMMSPRTAANVPSDPKCVCDPTVASVAA